MKKKYCINIDQCVVLPTIIPIFWNAILLILFLFMLWAQGSKDMIAFWEARRSGWRLWFYLSGPISLMVSIVVSFIFVVFPVSYVEFGPESMRIHRAFKRDRLVRYEEVFYARLKSKRKKEWLLAHFLLAEACEVNTIEIRKDPPFGSIWLSSSARTYNAIAKHIKAGCSGKKELTEGDDYIAETQWVMKHGSPQNIEWGGHYGKY